MIQVSENDPVHTIIIHYSEEDLSFGATHPLGFLYQRPVNAAKARESHQNLVNAIRNHPHVKDIRILTLNDILAKSSAVNRERLEKLALSRVQYKFDPRVDQERLTDREKFIFGEEYKRQAIAAMSIDQLCRVIITNPIITLSNNDENLPIVVTDVKISPMANLHFTRDQQIVTAKGVVMGDMQYLRKGEVELMKYCHEVLGNKVIFECTPPLHLEGGDFFPVSEEICFIGIGPRTNESAVRELMKRDVFGTRRVAVVRNIFDRNESARHLDDVFNIVSRDCCIILDSVIGRHSLTRRLVTEYFKDDTTPNGRYYVSARDVELSEYMAHLGYHVIPIPKDVNDLQALNVLNLGDGHLLVSSPTVAKILDADEKFKGTITMVDYSGINSMYGGIRATTMTFRTPRKDGGDSSLSSCVTAKKEVLTRLSLVVRPPEPQQARQTTNTIMMVAPIGFRQNLEALEDNYFMQKCVHVHDIHKQALLEFSSLHKELVEVAKVNVILYTSEIHQGTPDAVFPNNWVTTHPAGEIPGIDEPIFVLYPMKVPTRQRERRHHIVQDLESAYRQVNMTSWEQTAQSLSLEGTGVLVLDRIHRIAYASISQRCDPEVLEDWAERMNYSLCTFHSSDALNRPIYHTNVLMNLGTTCTIICGESIKDLEERARVFATLGRYHEIIDITFDQLNHMCGNAIELRGNDGKRVMVMSTSAYNHFTEEQKATMFKHVDRIVHADISTIERIGGGSVRCTIAELF
eukprot:GEZU01023484.1.p1 GENE.GEZU01023484.1~~GEZU01023484.1.p1  ORF type:complete len:746 (+),score=224.03 GEZU01023484.1:179-2416(+)